MAATIASAFQSIMNPLWAAMRRTRARARACASAFLLLAVAALLQGERPASAADAGIAQRSWLVQDLKGAGFSRPGDAGDVQWRTLRAGGRIEPGSVVRTDDSGVMELTNGIDHIRLSPGSEIELPAAQSGDPVTRVIHWLGTAFFQVGKRPGPQFEVDTPYIVAIVKGTKFTTRVSDAGAAISVTEGIVGVSATAGGPSIDVTAGGSAAASAAHPDTVTPGGPSGDAAPAGARGNAATLAKSGDDPPSDVDTDVETGTMSSAGGTVAASPSGGDPTARGGGGGNGNGRGRDDRAGNDAIRNQGGQDGQGDDDTGGGCYGSGNPHQGGHGHGSHGHGSHDHGGHGHGHDRQ